MLSVFFHDKLKNSAANYKPAKTILIFRKYIVKILLHLIIFTSLTYRKILLIRPGCTDKQRSNLMAYIWGAYIEEAYIWEEKHFNLQSVKLTFISFFFFQHKARISTFFMLCKMWNMFKVNNKDNRICKVNNRDKNEDTIDIVLASLLLTLNKLHFELLLVFLLLTLIS